MSALLQRVLAEGLGTALLLATVVGSGVMGVKLSGGNDGVALLANAGATAGMLYVLINVLGPISGAHFNPAVSLAMAFRGEQPAGESVLYAFVQGAAAIAGVIVAHAMFDLPWIQTGVAMRTGPAQWLGEAVATFGLLMTILLGAKHRPSAIAGLVAAYIFAAYWFTSSTSFANPAVTFARSFTGTFSGIRPPDVLGFLLAQAGGVMAALAMARMLGAGAKRRD